LSNNVRKRFKQLSPYQNEIMAENLEYIVSKDEDQYYIGSINEESRMRQGHGVIAHRNG